MLLVVLYRRVWDWTVRPRRPELPPLTARPSSHPSSSSSHTSPLHTSRLEYYTASLISAPPRRCRSSPAARWELTPPPPASPLIPPSVRSRLPARPSSTPFASQTFSHTKRRSARRSPISRRPSRSSPSRSSSRRTASASPSPSVSPAIACALSSLALKEIHPFIQVVDTPGFGDLIDNEPWSVPFAPIHRARLTLSWPCPGTGQLRRDSWLS